MDGMMLIAFFINLVSPQIYDRPIHIQKPLLKRKLGPLPKDRINGIWW